MNPKWLFRLQKKVWDLDVKRFAGKDFDTGKAWKETVGERGEETYVVSFVQRMIETNGVVIFPTMSMQTSEAEDIEQAGKERINIAEMQRFVNRTPGNGGPFWKCIQRHELDAATMLPRRSEWQIRSRELHPGFSVNLGEKKFDTYKRVR